MSFLRRFLPLLAGFSGLSALLLLSGCTAKPAGRLQVVTTTTLLSSVVREVSGDKVDVAILIPPGSCPGHFDLRPGHIQAVAHSGLLLVHGYEEFIPRLVESAGNSRLEVRRVGADENWLVPEVQSTVAAEVARILSEIDSERAAAYQERTTAFNIRVKAVEQDLKASLQASGVEGQPVLCAELLAPLMKWMGFEVVGTYGRPEELTPTVLHELVTMGRERTVRLVVDNLQSGHRSGEQLADEIGAAHVTLSNFPGGFTDTEDWEDCLRDDVRRVVDALGND